MGTTTSQQLPPKLEVARALLLRGNIFLHLAPRRPGVLVPEYLREHPQLVLEIGLDMVVPIPDLRLDDEGFSGTLSFARTPTFCRVPWDAVFALRGDDGWTMVWPESLPEELLAEMEREMGARPPAGFDEEAELDAREDLLEPRFSASLADSDEIALDEHGEPDLREPPPLEASEDYPADDRADDSSSASRPALSLLEGGGAGAVRRIAKARGHLKLIK